MSIRGYDESMRGRRPLILGYHGIGAVAAAHDPIALYTDPAAVTAHVRSLRRRGYEFVTMREFAARSRAAGEPPRGVVALTFDDGTVDHATVLPGLLGDLGVPGTVFVCPGLAGRPYPWTHEDAGVRFMSEDELIGLATHPAIEIGAHTNEHRELHEADADTALAEMGSCKERLEGLLGVEVLSFCYPRCHYSVAAPAAARRAGYASAVTCGTRGSWELYELQREVFHTHDGPLVSGLRLRGRYAALGSSVPALGARFAARAGDRLARVLRSGRR